MTTANDQAGSLAEGKYAAQQKRDMLAKGHAIKAVGHGGTGTAEGKTPREIRRCLKRYIARELYPQLTHAMTPQPSP